MATIDATTPQVKLIKQGFDAFVSRDLSKTESLLSKNFKMRSFPKAAEYPDETKEDYLKKRGGLVALLSKAELIIHEMIEAPGKVVFHVTCVSTFDGPTLDYDCVVIATIIEEDGEFKILEFKEFCDPQQRGAVFAEAAKVLAKRSA